MSSVRPVQSRAVSLVGNAAGAGAGGGGAAAGTGTGAGAGTGGTAGTGGLPNINDRALEECWSTLQRVS